MLRNGPDSKVVEVANDGDGYEQLANMPRTRRPVPRKFGILIVDDDETTRNLLNLWLRQQGFAVWLAADGREAQEIYRRSRSLIDLALLDVRMPGLDGPATLAGLQEMNPHIHTCFMSGDLGNYAEETLLGLGAARVFSKPFDWAEVMQVLWELAKKADLSLSLQKT